MDLPQRLREKVDEWLGRTDMPAAPAAKKRAKTEGGGTSPPPKSLRLRALGRTSVNEAEQ